MRTALQALLFLLGILACCAVSYLIGVRRGYERGSDCPIKSDTCWVVDTHFVEKPVEVWKTKEKPVYLAVHDTQIVHTTDSVFVALEREIKGYSGEEYEAQVSGIEPSLDWVKVFPKTAYITNTVMEKRKWGFGASVGPSIVYDGHIRAGLGVTIGLQYNF